MVKKNKINKSNNNSYYKINLISNIIYNKIFSKNFYI